MANYSGCHSDHTNTRQDRGGTVTGETSGRHHIGVDGILFILREHVIDGDVCSR